MITMMIDISIAYNTLDVGSCVCTDIYCNTRVFQLSPSKRYAFLRYVGLSAS